jgi:uncharacterized SAM-binding protein YcdF (DUF218 family)
LLAVFYSPVADYVVQPLWVPSEPKPVPALVVLTAWVSAEGVMNESALRRTMAAARLFRSGLAPLVIISGGDPTRAPERQHADFMAEFAGELGVPRSKILLEKGSKNTYESGVKVSSLCRDRGIRRVILVTDAVHLRRAVAVFEAQGLEVLPVAADPWTLGWETPQARLAKFLAALHEYEGLLYYRWQGWI